LWVYVANGIGFFQDVEALSDEDRGYLLQQWC